MMPRFVANHLGLEILTPSGFKPFSGVSLQSHCRPWKITLDTGHTLVASWDHPVFTDYAHRVAISELRIGDPVMTRYGPATLVNREAMPENSPLYDVIEVDSGHQFYANDILSSNCEFISFEETLINPVKLAALRPTPPIRTTGQVRWFKEIDPMATYVVSLDPAMGTGGDSAAIQVLELPSLTQVAEWCSNRQPIESQMRTMRDILEEIHQSGRPEIYWSVENNSVGEAALVVIRDTGEENFRGTMIHDPRNRAGGKYGRRSGYLTTHKTKMEACSRMKSLLESGRLKVNSVGLITELKFFVSRSNSYEARSGQTDDLVMSLLLAVRMAETVAQWDEASQNAVNSNIGAIASDEEDFDGPMPIFI